MVIGRVQYLGESKFYHIPMKERVLTAEYSGWYELPIDLCNKLWRQGMFYPDQETFKLMREHQLVEKRIIDHIWEGEKVFIVASGGSLEGFDYSRLDKYKTIVINHTLMIFPTAKALIFLDDSFVQLRRESIRQFKGLIFSSMRTELGFMGDNIFYYASNPKEFSPEFNQGLYGKRTTLCAINLALIMGASEVYLLGVDLNPEQKTVYCYENQIDAIDKNRIKYLNKNICDERIREFDIFLPYKDKIFNCSPISKVNQFEFRNIDEVLK